MGVRVFSTHNLNRDSNRKRCPKCRQGMTKARYPGHRELCLWCGMKAHRKKVEVIMSNYTSEQFEEDLQNLDKLQSIAIVPPDPPESEPSVAEKFNSDVELSGMWENADFLGGSTDIEDEEP